MASEMQVFHIIDLYVCINRMHMNVHNDFLYIKTNILMQHFQIYAMIQIFQRMIDLLFQ